MYQKLREFCLTNSLQSTYPEWPFPLLFHGQEITRDIFFLDPAIECHAVDLGKNPVQDASFFRYRLLNRWFHYQFFNGIAPIMCSAETLTLLPRLYRLQRFLLQSAFDSSLADYLQREFAVSEPHKLVESLLDANARLIEIASEHPLVVWGVRMDAVAAQEHGNYIAQVVANIRTDLVLGLPHLRSLAFDWRQVLRNEMTEFRKTEAHVNKLRKQRARRT